MAAAFDLTGVVHLVRPAFMHATNLDELRDGIARADAGTLFFHAIQSQLRSPAGDDLPPDDFSSWVHGVVQDRETAERLSFAVQQRGEAADPLRASLLAALDRLPAAARRARAAPEGGVFVFLGADSVLVPIGRTVTDANGLFEALAESDASVWFHELIERPWFDAAPPPAARWLREVGDLNAARWLEEAARSGRPLPALRRGVLARWRRRSIGARVAAAAQQPDDQRREAGRDAVARLARRLRRGTEAP
jgi:hypothetical protein